MTEIDYAALRELMAKATPGPWRVFTPDEYEGPNSLPTLGVESVNGDAVVWYADTPECGLANDADAHLIAAAISNFPALLTAAQERDALAVEVERLRDDLRFVERWANHHAMKPSVTPAQALGVIQHYPPISDITKAYADGDVPDTRNPWAELQAAEAKHAALVARIQGRIGELNAESRALPTLSHKGASIDYCIRQLGKVLADTERQGVGDGR